jgi:two-component system, chemotaxis family, protein-glutamate methylesterase/glutaminase
MANRDVVAIGTSAGGVQALLFLAKAFRQDFPASILVTSHRPSSLDQLLSPAGPLPASFAVDGPWRCGFVIDQLSVGM